jgi:hypothetical protein
VLSLGLNFKCWLHFSFYIIYNSYFSYVGPHVTNFGEIISISVIKAIFPF